MPFAFLLFTSRSGADDIAFQLNLTNPQDWYSIDGKIISDQQIAEIALNGETPAE